MKFLDKLYNYFLYLGRHTPAVVLQIDWALYAFTATPLGILGIILLFFIPDTDLLLKVTVGVWSILITAFGILDLFLLFRHRKVFGKLKL